MWASKSDTLLMRAIGSYGHGMARARHEMPIVQDLRRDVAAAKKLRLRWWAILPLIICAVFVSWAFDHFGRLATALPTMNVAAVFAFILFLKRNLIGQPWFWATLILVAIPHVLLILLAPWTTSWFPAIAIGGIDSLDFCVLLGVIAMVGRFMDGPKAVR